MLTILIIVHKYGKVLSIEAFLYKLLMLFL